MAHHVPRVVIPAGPVGGLPRAAAVLSDDTDPAVALHVDARSLVELLDAFLRSRALTLTSVLNSRRIVLRITSPPSSSGRGPAWASLRNQLSASRARLAGSRRPTICNNA